MARTLLLVLLVMGVAGFLYWYGTVFFEILFKDIFNGTLQQNGTLTIILNALILIVGTVVFQAISKYFISRHFERIGKPNEGKVIIKLYTCVLWLFVGLIILFSVLREFGALLTSLGLIGFGITFALQKPLLNFVGWMAINVTNPFGIGDRIEVNKIRGDVVSIHTMYTKIRGTVQETHVVGDHFIHVPNEILLTNPIINYSRLNGLYFDEIRFSITLESNWKKAVHIAETVTEQVTRSLVKGSVPVSKAEKQAWIEAVDLLEKASRKIRKGFLRRSVKENIEVLKSAESVSQIQLSKPNIQLSVGDYSIQISIIYQTDLYALRATKTEITKAFMDEIRRHKDIELAYPHLQIIHDGKLRKILPSEAGGLSKYLEEHGKN
ncbi:MAG: mechanosensitive ion channel [Candidatus Diapherotrites archaeon]|nr:mechanosensitive ion channel [Candidatus Diapherotrites archaeon]